jgi:hypothetical protein
MCPDVTLPNPEDHRLTATEPEHNILRTIAVRLRNSGPAQPVRETQIDLEAMLDEVFGGKK